MKRLTSLAASLLGGVLLLPTVFAAEQAAPATGLAMLAIKPLEIKQIVYRGMANFDHAGIGTGAMLYPVAGPEGLVAAILTHGIIASSAKQQQKDQIQTDADKVLLPYRPVLDAFSPRELMKRTIAQSSTGLHATLIEDAGDHGAEAIAENQPVFSLTPDQSALVLDNAISLRLQGRAPKNGYHNSVRIVSPAKKMDDPVAFWTDNGGEKLKEESARLVAESLVIALRDALSDTEATKLPYRTVRYQLGGKEQIERAQVLDNQCGRMLIRTLRGALMSVPAANPEDSATCATDSHHARLDS